jgi:hypothetical protein
MAWVIRCSDSKAEHSGANSIRDFVGDLFLVEYYRCNNWLQQPKRKRRQLTAKPSIEGNVIFGSEVNMKLLMASLLLTFLTQAAFPRTPPQTRRPLRKSDAVECHPAFSFTGKLVFEGKIVRGSIRKSEIDSLLTRRVELSGSPSDPEYGLGFTFPEGHFPVFSCKEWVQARAQGLSSELNTRERAAESFFVHTCSF